MKRTAALLLLAGLLAACTSGKSGPAKIVTVTVPPPSHRSTQSASSSASASATPTALTRLNGTCDTLLPDPDVIQALGGTPLGGRDAFVVGVPEKDIGRIGYLNCRYGVTGTGTAAKPKVEIGISLYGTPAQATTRVQATVSDYEAHGATAGNATVGAVPATRLTGGAGDGYDIPLLVVASGQRTVAVSIDPSLVSGSKAATAETTLASLALQRTGG